MSDENKNKGYFTEKNRQAWNEVAPIHQRERQEDLEAEFAKPGYSTLDEIITDRLLSLSLQGKTVAQISCNNGRELLSILNLGAAKGIGFDISDAFIEEGKRLAAASELDAEFIRCDALEIPEKYFGKYDLVYISIGALPWIPDLPLYFSTIFNLLKPGGDLLIYEMHPFLNMLAVPREPDYTHPYMVTYSYFEEEVLVGKDGLDYYGRTTYDASPNYEFIHTLSEILNGIAKSGLRLLSFDEYDHDISMSFDHLKDEMKLPLCYILHARKN